MASARAICSEFGTIADICDLQPIEGWKRWEDDHKNLLYISKKNSIIIKKTDKIVETTRDLFIKAYPEDIANHSYFILALFSDNRSLLAFLGNDGLLRCSEFINGKWICNLKPLLLGISILSLIVNEYLSETKKIEKRVLIKHLDFKVKECWVTPWPSFESENLKERLECLLKRNQEK